jgi:hypothetical protein
MTPSEARAKATELCNVSIHEPWETLREGIVAVLLQASPSGTLYSQESVDALKDELEAWRESALQNGLDAEKYLQTLRETNQALGVWGADKLEDLPARIRAMRAAA